MIAIPKVESFSIPAIARALLKWKGVDGGLGVVGIRPGEKLHEEMITDTDSLNTIDLGKYYAILPSVSFTYTETEYLAHHKATKVPFGFKYNSGTNEEWETAESLKSKIAVIINSGQ